MRRIYFDTNQIYTMRKLALSLLAVLIGWASGFIYYVAFMTFFTPGGRPTDVEFILVWTAVFIIISWLVFVLPLIFMVPESSRIFSLAVAPCFGAVCGLAAFLLLVGWWTGFWAELLYVVYALVVGAATGLAYAVLLHVRRKSAPVESERS